MAEATMKHTSNIARVLWAICTIVSINMLLGIYAGNLWVRNSVEDLIPSWLDGYLGVPHIYIVMYLYLLFVVASFISMLSIASRVQKKNVLRVVACVSLILIFVLGNGLVNYHVASLFWMFLIMIPIWGCVYIYYSTKAEHEVNGSSLHRYLAAILVMTSAYITLGQSTFMGYAKPLFSVTELRTFYDIRLYLWLAFLILVFCTSLAATFKVLLHRHAQDAPDQRKKPDDDFEWLRDVSLAFLNALPSKAFEFLNEWKTQLIDTLSYALSWKNLKKPIAASVIVITIGFMSEYLPLVAHNLRDYLSSGQLNQSSSAAFAKLTGYLVGYVWASFAFPSFLPAQKNTINYFADRAATLCLVYLMTIFITGVLLAVASFVNLLDVSRFPLATVSLLALSLLILSIRSGWRSGRLGLFAKRMKVIAR